MATRFLNRFLLTTTKQSLSCLRPLVSAPSLCRVTATVFSYTRGFATRETRSSLNDTNPNWSNRSPKETILLEGCDFEHWLVVMENPEGDQTRDDIIDSYIKTLASILGSEEEARMKIYSVSTRHYFAFGALVSEELSYKLKGLPRVRWVLPDSYLDVRNKDYGGEPFINGQAVPYDPKYHADWVKNNDYVKKRNNRDRSRNNSDIARRREIQRNNQNSGGNFRGSSGNTGNLQFNPGQMQPNAPMQQPYLHPQQPNIGAHPPSASTGNYYPPNNRGSNSSLDFQHSNSPINYQSGPRPNRNYNPNVGSGIGTNAGSGYGHNSNSFSANQGGYSPIQDLQGKIKVGMLRMEVIVKCRIITTINPTRACLDEMRLNLVVTEKVRN